MSEESELLKDQDYYFKEFMRVKSYLGTKEGVKNAYNLKIDKSIYMLATSPKCGTTWVQQICHQLRTRGNMDFEEITKVIPFIEMADDYDIDLNQKQTFKPNIYKTHFWYDHCPKGGKYIYVTRHPYDAANSYYHFFANWLFKKENISIDYFIQNFWLARDTAIDEYTFASYFHHLISYYFKRKDDDLLWLHYEDLLENKRKCIILIAQFLNIDASDTELIDLVEKQSSREFMGKHRNKFNDGPLKRNLIAKLGLPPETGFSNHEGKITGSNSDKEKISSDIKKKIDEKWEKVITSITGYKTYDELRAGINRDLGRDFSN